jgi:flagellin
MMATNGAQASRLQFALDALSTQKVNVEAANSRIYDVDVAAETTRLARANILVQSGAAMLAQANAASQIALKLLQ